MTTRIRVVEKVYSGWSRVPDQDDEWDNGDTYEVHQFLGFEVVQEGKYYDLEVPFEVVEDRPYYLVIATYSTGSTFGREDGKVDFVWLFEDREPAKKVARELELAEQPGYDDSKSRWSVELDVGLERPLVYSVPWWGYFEQLTDVEVRSLEVVDSRSMRW